ncbi:PEGA domain protein [Planctomycetes bacterium MalM25]|nr:PEGA domain protein [Planctomycetes bacterium MalM25]
MFLPFPTAASRPASTRIALAVLLIALATSGCVRRRLTVRSNPPGAIVHVDNQRIGTTPCSIDYVYYGTREIRLSLPGFETLTVNQPLPAPWYETPGIDFISENLVPARIEDARTVSFNLQRTRLEAPETVIARGEELRRQMTPLGAAPVVPAAAAIPTTQPPGGYVGPPVGVSPGPPPAAPAFAPPPAGGYAPPASASPTPAAPGLPDAFRY